MKKAILISILLLLACGTSFAQLNPQLWSTLDQIGISAGSDSYCWSAGQHTFTAGYFVETASYGSYTCNGISATYATASIFANTFSFTYGTVKVRAKAAGSGVHSGIIWMVGGDSSSTGYPATCRAGVLAKTIVPWCVPSGSDPQYEVDIGEIQPGAGLGVNGNGNFYHVWKNGGLFSTSGSQINAGVDLTQAFHVYELDWSPTQLIFKLDGTTTTTLNIALSTPEFPIMDGEIDSTAPPQSSGFYPLTTEYDYIRICSSYSTVCNPGDATMIFEDEFNTSSTQAIGVSIQGATIQ